MLGILDLQGGVVEHLEHLSRLQIPARRVKRADDLDNLAGLIIPGGESTCLSRLLRIFHLDQAISQAHAAGMKVWGTCAGAILVATEVIGEPAHLRLIDISISRNAYGSQLDSFQITVTVPAITSQPIPLTFIRAPKIVRTGVGVDVLLQLEGAIVAAENDSVMVTTFHPELTPALAFHRYFAQKCGLNLTAVVADLQTDWQSTNWTRLAPLPRAR